MPNSSWIEYNPVTGNFAISDVVYDQSQQTVTPYAGSTPYTTSGDAQTQITADLAADLVAHPGSVVTTDAITYPQGGGKNYSIRSASGSRPMCAVSGTISAVTTDGQNFTYGTMPSGNWTQVVHGASGYLALAVIGSSGLKIANSTDGINWTAYTLFNDGSNINSPQLVTDGTGYVLVWSNQSNIVNYSTSVDGMTWTSPSAATGIYGHPLVFVIYAGGKYVSVDNSGFTATSTDCANWTQGENLPAFNNGNVRIAYNGSAYLAAGYATYEGGPTSYSAHSTDGITFVGASIPGTASFVILNPVAIGSTFALVGTSHEGVPYAAYSTDNGATWTSTSMPPDSYSAEWLSVCYNGAVAFAPSNVDGLVSAVSADGITWAGYPINDALWAACCSSGSGSTEYYVDYTETDLLLIGTITNLTYN